MLLGLSAGLGAGALWALVFIAPRMVPAVSAVDLAAGRFVVYGALAAVLLVAGLRTRRLPQPSQAFAAILLSVLGFSGYYLLLVWAIRDAGTEVPALVVGTIPVWLMILGRPAHLRWRVLLPGLLLTMLGVGLMVSSSIGRIDGAGAHFWRGTALAFASTASWTMFALLNARWLRRHPEFSASDWANWTGVFSGLGALALWLVAGSPMQELAAQAELGTFVFLAIGTGAGSAWLATVLWNVASRRLPPSLCGQLIVSETLFALLYSFAWDRQLPTTVQLWACLAFVLGIVATIAAHR